MCLGEGRRGTEDSREEQQGEGKRGRNAIPKAVGTWRPPADPGLCPLNALEDSGGPEQRGQNLTWLKSTPTLPRRQCGLKPPVGAAWFICWASAPRSSVEGGGRAWDTQAGQVRTLYFSYRSAEMSVGCCRLRSMGGRSTSPWKASEPRPRPRAT